MIQPPPGAGPTNGPAQPPQPAAWLNAAPLPEPCNVFAWLAGVTEHYANQDPRLNTPDTQQKIAWLRELAKRIDAKHRDPVIMMAIGRAALDAQLRASTMAVLQRVDELTQAAAAGRQI